MADNIPAGDGDKGGPQSGGTPWHQGYEGVDAEMIGHWQNKGVDASDPKKIAVAMSKFHRDAEKLIGVRADHDLLPVPKAPDKGDWNAVWTKLGKPAKEDEYDFASVNFANGTKLDDNFVQSMRTAAYKANLPKGAATEMVKAFVGFMDGQDSRDAGAVADKIKEERAALAKDWGTTPEGLTQSPHMTMAKQAAAALGVDVEAVNALEKGVGYAAVMRMFRNIAGKIGEDKWFSGDKSGQGLNGVLTTEQAIARKSTLKADPAWVTKFLSGDAEARREMASLDQIIVAANQR
jgi:hypothetical protein